VFTCILSFNRSHAQTTDSTLHALNEVVILESKQQQLQPSKKTTETDSVILARYNTSSLSELLSSQSAIYIKSYGNGNIATSSMRGGNASQTAVLWNGFNLQNSMLGQTDLSIVPGSLFEKVSLEYGGGSALWGSGALGGSIHLQNKLLFDKGVKTKIQTSVGSFDSRKLGSTILLSYKKIASSTRVYYSGAKNNYTYKDTTDKEDPNKQVTHADYSMKGFMQELSFLANAYQKINIRAWYNTANRNLPSYSTAISKQNQQDENLRLSADWNYSKRRLNSTLRAAYFNDKLNYNDSLANIYSKSTTNTFIGESDNVYVYKNHKLNFGINYTQYKSNLYDKKPGSYTVLNADTIIRHELDKMALFAAYQLSLFGNKLNYNLSVRKEFTNQTGIPFTGNTGIRYQLLKWIALKANANKAYRQPTLNDLYWPQSGNPNLKPEEGYEVDGGIETKLSKKNLSFLFEATYFNRHTTNWIIWLPGNNGLWSPRNIAEVYSRGTETKTELTYAQQYLRIKLIINTAYVLSTNQKSLNENDNSVGRQLTYTPRYTGQASLVVSYQKFVFLFNQSYTGYRFTATDNTSWLYPYYLANAKVSYGYSFSTVDVELFAGINNVFNKNYMVVTRRPMPLRNFEAGIALHYTQKKKTTNNNISTIP
jgi:iron complex outermembrane receptor protein